jgi:hypothetical protein
MTKLAYTIQEAADATGYSESVVKDAMSRGDLIPSYENTKPVFRRTELERWLDAMPAEPVKRKRT